MQHTAVSGRCVCTRGEEAGSVKAAGKVKINCVESICLLFAYRCLVDLFLFGSVCRPGTTYIKMSLFWVKQSKTKRLHFMNVLSDSDDIRLLQAAKTFTFSS